MAGNQLIRRSDVVNPTQRLVPDSARRVECGDVFGCRRVVGEPFYEFVRGKQRQSVMVECKCKHTSTVRVDSLLAGASCCRGCNTPAGNPRAADLSGVTRDWLWQRYVVEDVGVRGVAALLGCASRTAGRLLRAHRIAVRRARIGQKWTGCGDMSGTYWTALVQRAARFNWSVGITKQDAWELFLTQNRRCYFTGVLLTFRKSTRDPTEQTASLDRLDSACGYVRGNVAWVHKRVNEMKMCDSPLDFITWCRRVVAHADSQQKATQ